MDPQKVQQRALLEPKLLKVAYVAFRAAQPPGA